jgi:hypothetical protein
MVRNFVTIADFVQLLLDVKGISQLLLAGKMFKKKLFCCLSKDSLSAFSASRQYMNIAII